MDLEDLIVFEGTLLVLGVLLAHGLQALHAQNVMIGLVAGVLDVLIAGTLTIFVRSKRL